MSRQPESDSESVTLLAQETIRLASVIDLTQAEIVEILESELAVEEQHTSDLLDSFHQATEQSFEIISGIAGDSILITSAPITSS